MDRESSVDIDEKIDFKLAEVLMDQYQKKVSTLNDKVIIITGGAGLIGKEFVKAIIRENGTAIIADINDRLGKKVKDTLSNELDTTNIDFVKLDINLSRQLGIGNSTGLGMAPFIINHPALLHQWIHVREEALKQIREIKYVTNNELGVFKKCLEFSKRNIDNWNTSSQFQKAKIKQLKQDIQKFESEYDFSINDCEYFWDKTYKWIEENLSYEGIEYIVSLMMEPYDNIVSHLVPQMSADEDQFFNIPTERSTKELKEIIEKSYPNILAIDFSMKKSNENFWFISKNKEEPRIANRFEEDGSQLEQPLAIARDIKELYNRLSLDKNQKLSKFLENNNDLRHIVRRCYVVEKLPYAEIQDNSIGSELMPIDMLRLKLSFFGAQKFDPRSDKWLRICMYQGAPLMHEINLSNDTWIYN